jgi:hypothetical protein
MIGMTRKNEISFMTGSNRSIIRLKLISVLLMAVVLGACVPQIKSNSNRSKSRLGSTTDTNPKNTDSNPTPVATVNSTSLYWYDQGAQLQDLTIDASNLRTIRLRGNSIEQFLAIRGTTQRYCLVASFSGTAFSQLRARVVPEFVSGEYRMRVDFPDQSINSSFCGDTSGMSTFSPATLCPSCNTLLTANSVRLFASDGTNTTSQVGVSEPPFLSLNGLFLRVNPLNNTNNQNTCTDQACGAQGYDCCLQNQCVVNGQTQPQVNTSSVEYLIAEQEKLSNPLAYLNYPQLYFICSNTPTPTPTPTPTSDSVQAAKDRLKSLGNQYLCLKCDTTNGENPSASFCGASGIELSYGETLTFTSCTYSSVTDSVANLCGCQPDTPNCPGYSLVMQSNQMGQATDFTCSLPAPDAQPTPFQELSIQVPSRSVPHRFFDSDTGEAVDELSTASANGHSPEGTEFLYLDPATQLLPQNGDFNMNSLTGQFSVDLSGAYPAKVINVEFDETYILSATSGYYTPCPSCAVDSWFNLFRPHPASQMGRGVQPIGFTTSRNNAGTNLTYGNYEDNIFSRACFVPPTMLPFAHKGESSVQQQRLNRLKTQAAMYINGYQRDWFGFNKGALIGSFDGVSWFAIGKGRRIRAKSSKLFLALNGMYGDLAAPTNINVHIVQDEGIATAAEHDYDPDLPWNHVNQTEAATCRKFHQCEVDRDCISQLGWEYVCARTSSLKTLWPRFNNNAEEQLGDGYTYNGIQLLTNAELPGDSLKRCVYRGRGAPCRKNIQNFSNEQNRRIYSCAPNFYCADIQSNHFNSEVARFAADFDNLLQATNHRYGHDALHLGRPLSYLGDSKSLDSDIQTNITYNANNAMGSGETFGNDLGLCLPGKDPTETNTFDAQNSRDALERTDYISQVGTCNSGATHSDTTVSALNSRLLACPLIDQDGNYAHFNYTQTSADGDLTTQFINSSTGFFDFNEGLRQLRSQNSCGGESTHTSTVDSFDGSYLSAFKSVESAPLSTIPSNIFSETLAKDACLRRAGSPCHTDLDCSPNALHESVASVITSQYFGSNKWEQSYWQESLVCAQGEREPRVTDDDYSTAAASWDMSQNRCCREIGFDLTVASQNENSADAQTQSLDTSALAVYSFNSDNRYSRYSILPYFNISTNPYNAGTEAEAYADWEAKTLISGFMKFPPPRVPALANDTLARPYQWKTLSATAQKTCCGGGYIRKFADGTHDWSQTNRFQYDISQFKCLNYPNKMAQAIPSFFAPALTDSTFPTQTEQWAIEVDKACQDPSREAESGGCLQHQYAETSGEEQLGPSDYTDSDFPDDLYGIDTIGVEAYTEDNTNFTIRAIESTLNDPFSPYLPVDALFHPQAPDPINLAAHADKDGSASDIKFFLPAYVNGIQNLVYIVLERGVDGVTANVPCYCDISGLPITQAINPPGIPQCNPVLATDPTTCTVTYESSNNTLLIHNGFHENGDTLPSGFTMGYRTLGSNFLDGMDLFPAVEDDATTSNHIEYRSNDYSAAQNGYYQHKYTKPGNDLYYLTKLARFELAGIPQIYFEPIRCNDDREQLVPGFFNSSTWAQFMDSDDTFNLSDFTVNAMAEGTLKESLLADENDNVGNNDQDDRYLAGQNEIATDAIFSSETLTCCVPLNTETTGSMSNCCSSHWTPTDGTSANNPASASRGICKLPNGADLNLYYNPFVSGEYLRKDMPVTFEDQDFDPYTGEPLISTNIKLIQIGAQVCASGSTRYGAAFGNFNGKPIPRDGYFETNSGDYTVYSLLDSYADQDATGYAGSFQFSQGFRWNHHIYCAP